MDVISGGWNVRTGVQEYGGGAAIVYDGSIYFSNIKDGRVYVVKKGGLPQPVTPGMMPDVLIDCCNDPSLCVF